MKKKTRLRDKFLLARLKSKAVDLRANYQIPRYLSFLILNLKETDDIKYITFLKEMSEYYLRVKGFYKRYQRLDAEAERDIKTKKGDTL